jgi:hypothetical protein
MGSPRNMPPNRLVHLYKRRGRAPSLNTNLLEQHLIPTFALLHFDSHLEQGKATIEGLTPWIILGINNMKSSSIVLFSTYQYSHTYQLEYSSYVMILAYELAYSSYVMNLACRTWSLNIHTTYMIRIRSKLRWRFIIPLALPMSYAYWSVGSES